MPPLGIIELAVKNSRVIVDDVGRKRFKTPRTRHFFFFLRTVSNPLTDARDIKKCLVGAKKPVAMLIVDDCTSDGLGPSGHVAFLVLGTIWLHGSLDVLICMSYAANQSYRNPVELFFGWVSRRLARNVINVDPLQALKNVDTVMSRERYGYKVMCNIPPEGPDPCCGAYDIYPRFTRASNTYVTADDKLVDLYHKYGFLVDHCDRKTNFLAFIRMVTRSVSVPNVHGTPPSLGHTWTCSTVFPALCLTLTTRFISCLLLNIRRNGLIRRLTRTNPHLVVM